jgi:hypothetical protein
VEALKKRSLSARVAYATATLAGISGLALVLGSGIVRCPFAAVTHMPCPGCGSTRAVRAALSFDFTTAFRFNPAAPIVAACVGLIALEAIWLLLREGHVRDLAMRGTTSWAVRALVACTLLEIPIWALRFFGLFGGPVPI